MIRIVARLLRFLAPLTGRVVLSVLLGAAAVGSGVALLAISAYLISLAAVAPSIAALQIPIVAVRFFGIARGVFRYLERYISHTVTFRLLARLRVWFYQALEPLSPVWLGTLGSGDLLSRAVRDVDELQNFYVRAVAPPLVALVVSLGAGVVLLWFGPALAAALWAALILAGVGVPWLTRVLSRRPGAAQVRLRAGLRSSLVDSVQGLADVLAFGGGDYVWGKVACQSRLLARTEKKLAWIQGVEAGLSSLLTHLGVWIVLVLAIIGVGDGRIDGVVVAALTLLALASFETVQPLPAASRSLAGIVEAAERIFELVDASPAVEEAPHPLPPPVNFDLRVAGLAFRYGPDEPWVLKNLSFTLPWGERLAVVGPSGAGKTTLINLLMRFWEYEEGEIALGGSDLRGLRAAAVRRAIGVVDQDTYLFNATVRDNLRIAQPDAGMPEIEQAARAARLHRFIQSLPDGYDTWIGERGMRLSGGQRQRLALARTLLANPPILLLDEPTAHLDAVTEREILGEILSQAGNRSLVLVTHRLVGLEAMDQILVLEEGQLVAQGRHAELVKKDGWYQRMWILEQQTLPG